MTPEAKVKRVITNQLKELGAYYFYPATGGYGRSGVPDIVGCYRGRFFGIECKAGKNKPTALQQKNLDDIASTEGIALLINEANMKDVAYLLGAKANNPDREKIKARRSIEVVGN
jgi:penicillin-binding protein-related factor A (putative recombinase)